MDRGRILILGHSKESTYELRKLLDNKRFELEIALNPEVGKQVLTNRRMNLIIIHSELLREGASFIQFLRDRAIDVPIFVMGAENGELGEVPSAPGELHVIPGPFATREVLSRIRSL